MAIHFGGDYNPEQWPEDVWAQDVKLMTEAGVNLVTVGVFAWARIQPAEGVFDYGWLDRVLNLLHEHDIGVDLATGTASPPPWATTKYPGILPRTRDGAVLSPGSRQHYAPTSPDYRRLAAELVRRTAGRYHDHPAVRMWHVNNELGCHVAHDYGRHARDAFQAWLRLTYGTIDALNDAWGTMFWAQRFGDFAEVLPPRLAPAAVNPSGLLDFRRFSSDALLDLFLMEKRLLRAAGATQPITTNMMGPFPHTDYWRWADEVDVIADDSYPDPADPQSFREAAFARDLMRSLKPGRPWILMEQAPNTVNWRTSNAAKAPGQMAALSMQAVARGADGVMFFQWRQSAAGSEKFHSAMLPHAGPETRTFREITQLGRHLPTLDLPAPGGEARVAIVFDWPNWWALDQEGHPARIDYLAEVRGWHTAFHKINIQTDFVRPAGPFRDYTLVVVPSLYLMSGDGAAFESYVENGGSLLVSAFTDVVDEHDRFRPGGFTTRLRRVLGLHVTDHAGVGALPVRWEDHAPLTGTTLAETVITDGAEVVGSFPDGGPALTHHWFGRGDARYVATLLDVDSKTALAASVASMLGIQEVMGFLPENVEACARGRSTTLINHNPFPVEAAGHTLGPYGFVTLR